MNRIVMLNAVKQLSAARRGHLVMLNEVKHLIVLRRGNGEMDSRALNITRCEAG